MHRSPAQFSLMVIRAPPRSSPSPPISSICTPSVSGQRPSSATRRAANLASRRDRVDAFVDQHFSLAGTLRLHRRTIGWDLLRVPANLLLAPAMFGFAVLGRIARPVGLAQVAAWLGRHRPTFETAMAREVSWLVTTELLQLPCAQPSRAHADDLLLEMILADPRRGSA